VPFYRLIVTAAPEKRPSDFLRLPPYQAKLALTVSYTELSRLRSITPDPPRSFRFLCSTMIEFHPSLDSPQRPHQICLRIPGRLQDTDPRRTGTLASEEPHLAQPRDEWKRNGRFTVGHSARGTGCAKETIQRTDQRTSLIRSAWRRHAEFYNLQVVQRCTGSSRSPLQTNSPIPVQKPLAFLDNRLIYCRILNRFLHAFSIQS
jgi:hypothetical protein